MYKIITILLLLSTTCLADTTVEHFYVEENPVSLHVQYLSANAEVRNYVVDFWDNEFTEYLIIKAKKLGANNIVVFHREDKKVGVYFSMPKEGAFRYKGWYSDYWSGWVATKWTNI